MATKFEPTAAPSGYLLICQRCRNERVLTFAEYAEVWVTTRVQELGSIQPINIRRCVWDLTGAQHYKCPDCGDIDKSEVEFKESEHRVAVAHDRRVNAEKSLPPTALAKWKAKRAKKANIDDLIALKRELMGD